MKPAAPKPQGPPHAGQPVDHTPTTPAIDDRPYKILDRTPVPDEHKERLFSLVRTAQEAAEADGADLQAEFGKDAVAMIVGCNQFLRLFRGGASPGVVEVWLDDDAKVELADAGFTIGEPEGAIFRMFGWSRVDPMEGPAEALRTAVDRSYRRAKAAKK